MINKTRSSIRKMAADNGWTHSLRGCSDLFDRGSFRVAIGYSTENGRFYSAFLIDLTIDQDSLDCIADEGGVTKAKQWLRAS